MSKKDDKNPVPEDRLEHFIGIVWSLVEPFGVDEVADAMEYIRLLSESIERHNFEKRYKISPQKKSHSDRVRFISVFKSRYLEFADLEYTRPITGVDSKLISQANKLLSDNGFECTDYLKWIYTVFIPENEQFAPGNIKLVCSQVFLHKFLYEHREKKKEKENQELARKEGTMLLNRVRVLIRSNDDKKIIEDARNLVKRFKEESIILSEFRSGVKNLEQQAKRKQEAL